MHKNLLLSIDYFSKFNKNKPIISLSNTFEGEALILPIFNKKKI
jgi:hypothetical protein